MKAFGVLVAALVCGSLRAGARTVVEVAADRTLTAEEEIAADTVFDVKEGVTLDMASRALTIAGVTGKGAVSNAKLTLTLAEGPYRFDGTMAGTLTFSKTSAVSLDEFHFIVGGAETLKNVSYTEPNEDGCVLKFVPGVGNFSIKQITFASKQSLDLQDTNGDPIKVTSIIIESSKGNVKLTGPGDYVNLLRLGGGGMGYGIIPAGKTGGRLIEGSGDFDLSGNASVLSRLEGIGVDTASTSGGLRLSSSSSCPNFPCNLYWFNAGNLGIKFPTCVQVKQVRNYFTYSTWNFYGNLTISNGVFHSYGGGRTHAVASTTTLTLDDAALMSHNLTYPGYLRYDSASGYGSLTLVLTNGSYYGMSEAYPKRATVTTGSFLTLNGGSHGGTLENPTVIFVDGGAAGVILLSNTTSASLLDTAKLELQVGARGAKIRGETGHCLQISSSYVKGPVRTADGVATDGGVTIVGGGNWRFSLPLAINGPFYFREGFVTVPGDLSATADSTCFGTGDFIFGSGCFANESSISPFPLANGAGARLVVDGAADLLVKSGQSYAIGPADATASSLARTAGIGGVLILRTAGNLKSDGSGSKVTVAGGVVKRACGLPKVPVVQYDRSSDSSIFGTFGFLDYDETNGFVPFAGETIGLGGGANSVAKLTDAVTVSADTQVAALRQGWQQLTINAGATLKIGDDENPAPVLLASAGTSYGDYIARIQGAGTLDFGASEGVFLVPLPPHRNSHPVISATIAGSAGVSYNAACFGTDNGAWEAICLNGRNTYTGGTRLSGICAYAGTSDAFGRGTVRIDGGTYRGARLTLYAAGLVISNDIVVSGLGGPHYDGRDSTRPGAITFAYSSTLAGDVSVIDSAAFGTYENVCSGHEGVLDGVVSGDTVLILPGSGSIVMTRANTYTGRTVLYGKLILRGDAARAGTKDIVMPSTSAILRLENDGPVTIPNRIVGRGTIELAGTGAVTFEDTTSFCGTIDLCGRSHAVNELSDSVKNVISTGATAPCTLTVAGARTRLSATLGENVVIAPGAGGTLDLVGTARTVTTLAGAGRIFGASVSVTGEIHPGGEGAVGTLALATPPTLGADAKLVTEFDASGIDKLHVDGDFSLDDLPLEVRRLTRSPTQTGTIFETSQTLSGAWKSVTLPSRGMYRLSDIEDASRVDLTVIKPGAAVYLK